MVEVATRWFSKMQPSVIREVRDGAPTAASLSHERIKLLQWICTFDPIKSALHQTSTTIEPIHRESLANLSAPLAAHPENSEATLIVYSNECLYHKVPKQHVEQPSRQARTVQMLVAMSEQQLPPNAVQLLPEPDQVDPSLLECVHSRTYLRHLEKTCNSARKKDCMMRLNAAVGDFDTILSDQSYSAALHAAGAVCAAVERVVTGRAKNAFCCVRPPGHHAGRDGLALGAESQGFCLLNNVCIGMAHARLKCPWFTKMAVVDFDVHHGNGTEEILMNDPSSLFCSVHRYGQSFFPGKGSASRATENLVNIGLPKGFDAAAFRGAVSKQLLPVLEEFNPDVIFISAGFDAHRGDVLGGTLLTEADFEWITCELCDVADRVCSGRIISVMEGGYPAESSSGLEGSIMSHVRALAGLPEFNGVPSARRNNAAPTPAFM
eukprot:TRINITY_DN6659_c0_g2_i2.p1 TRINITY_DN6659_c0_g2~~TRINITY_DN6659_c0_g2_i2.p1  ORF type:complete len:436 (+),score=98.12 TRINITY_DN6659_c0_g2_i2:240-1547(+)